MTNILSAARGFRLFALLILIAYAIVPTTYWLLGFGNIFFLRLGGLTAISLVFLMIGYYVPLSDFLVRGSKRIRVPLSIIKSWLPLTFVCFITYTLITAPSIPLVSSLLGASAELLSEERGAFLKGRAGTEVILLYASTILVSTLIPYSLVVLFALKQKFRFLLFVVFFLYSVSFLQKALFLNVLLPLMVLYSASHKVSKSELLKFLLIISGLLLVLIALTYQASDSAGSTDFLAANYLPTGPLDFLLWRTFAVPIFTATDTLEVHESWFHADQLLGATSSLVSQIFGIERINIERYVFEFQFGGWNDIANANAVFFLDGYVNFGIIGVIVYSLIAGQFFRIFAKTKDRALSTLWIVFGSAAFSGSLLGLMLSNGWILVFGYALMFKNNEIESSGSRTQL